MSGRRLLSEALRAGVLAGLAMIPAAAVFRARGLRVNEYGRKTLELLVGQDVAPPLQFALTFGQHLVISVLAALPLLMAFERIARRPTRVVIGIAYGAVFYVVMNSLALPLAFGDPTPWALGLETVYPSLTIHLIYGAVLGVAARPKPHPTASGRRGQTAKAPTLPE